MKNTKKTSGDDSTNPKKDELESLIESKKIQNQAFQKIIKSINKMNHSKNKSI